MNARKQGRFSKSHCYSLTAFLFKTDDDFARAIKEVSIFCSTQLLYVIKALDHVTTIQTSSLKVMTRNIPLTEQNQTKDV